MIITNVSNSTISFIGSSNITTEILAGSSVSIADTELSNAQISSLISRGLINVSEYAPANVQTDLNTLIAGEDQNNDWLRTIDGGTQYYPVYAGQADKMLGVTGAAGDYLKSLVINVSTSANSQVILKDGTPTAYLSSYTHASTACTTTLINTILVPTALTANQLAGSVLRIAGQSRRILSHPANAANAVQAFTLDHALSAIPGTGVALSIDAYPQTFELVPAGAPVGSVSLDFGGVSNFGGWRITTDSGVSVIANGKFS